EDEQLLRVLGEVRDHLQPGRARADHRDPLVCKTDEVAVRRSSGVSVIPAARVERVAGEALDTRDARKLRLRQGSRRGDDVAGTEDVATVRLDLPLRRVLVPRETRRAGVPDEV